MYEGRCNGIIFYNCIFLYDVNKQDLRGVLAAKIIKVDVWVNYIHVVDLGGGDWGGGEP